MKETITLELSEREAALIFLVRRIGFGVIDTLGITKGQPAVIKIGAQRIDLERADALSACLQAGAFVAVDMTPAGMRSSIETGASDT